ncbi:MAG: NHLP family bacteriocin export ABC transporter peptidase/permease/ATPase subunit [Clostridiales bacterium]|nr:NHLP family bacteriocin export ABC transporter peptidase/permease/ATPase subunit [Clostridiales bacterium]
MRDRKYKKVPVIMQMEALECGAASLAMILAYHGKWLPLEQVRSDCGVSRDGSNAKNILKAARSYGLIAKAYRYEPQDLKTTATYPCIIHWNFNHFVVLCGFKGDKAVLNDPARGNYTVSPEEFDRAFTGICLCFEPGEEFVREGKKKSIVSYAMKRVSDARAASLLIAFASLLVSVIGIVSLAMSRTFVDILLADYNHDWLVPFTLILAGIGFLQIIVLAIKEIISGRVDGRFAASGSAGFMWKILHLPMEFFSQRMAADLQLRMTSNTQIAKIIVTTFAPLVLDAVMMIVYLAVMLKYSVVLTLIGVASVIANLAICSYISRKRTNILRVMLRDEGNLASSTVSGIEMIETIKSTGAENGFFEKWSGYQASVNSQEIEYLRTDYKIGILPELITALTEIVVLVIGVALAINGKFTPGMLLAFQGFLTAFTLPANKLMWAGQTLQELRSDIERVEDVMTYADDTILTEEIESDEYDKLSGSIEIKNITFGYSKLAEPLVTDFNLTVRPGQKIAIVGSSGCGKSTMAKLISGLYEPWSGEILFDGKKLSEIDRAVFTGSVAVVDQDIILFEDTIANNIKMWDSSIEDFEMIMAARDAKIHDDIIVRNGGYNYRIYEGGKDFSGGQKQRLEIARVLAQDPTIMIMDEATSALDAKTEYEVVKSITERGITCIVIAHRLSTIRDCDEIIVMDKGKIVERGTHDELYAQGGIYTRLIANE